MFLFKIEYMIVFEGNLLVLVILRYICKWFTGETRHVQSLGRDLDKIRGNSKHFD